MITEKVYTSTEYPPEYTISMHNELSYAHRWPGKLFFFCERAPETGGQTPIADGRRVLELLPPDLVLRFVERGVRYLRTMHDGRGAGLSWPTVFESTDRDFVSAYCREGGIDFEWRADGWLRTSQTRPAVVRHPGSGDLVWFNQADQWHPSNLGDIAGAMTSVGGEDLPLDATYGDGSPIDVADLEVVRDVCRQARIVFDWAAGDILVVDNTRMSHGRMPFQGPRRVLVSMGDPIRLDQVARA